MIVDVFVGMSSSMNNEKILQLSSIYWKATRDDLFNEQNLHEGIRPYIIEDEGYPLLPWLIMPHKQKGGQLFVLETLFNKQLCHVRIVVENSFGMLKKTF
jgi:hypothetical protein